MAAGYKNPPKFEEDCYERWKNELEIWQLVTDLEKKKQALAVTLSLTGKAREAALNIKAEDLNSDEGMNTLIETLDKLFLQETIDSAYDAYKNFDGFRKPGNMNIHDYIVEFDQRYQKSVKHKMTLPDAVLAFKLLDNANLSNHERQLALTACTDLSYDKMKSAMKRIFGPNRHSDQNSFKGVSSAIKQESAMLTEYRKPKELRNVKTRGTNPLNKFGKPTRCKICQSIFHWWKECPHNASMVKIAEHEDKNDDVKDNLEECNITLFTESRKIENEIFVVESRNSAVIDTACTQTVCGEKWLHQYQMHIKDGELRSSFSNRPFRFGDGQVVKSFKQVVLPAKIGSTKCSIKTEVVKANIPLLLSKESLKRADTVLDLKNDTAEMFGEPVKLHFTSSGHYCIDISNDESAEHNVPESTVLLIDENMDENRKKKILSKLHQQFGHSSANRLKQLLKSAGINNDSTLNMLDQIVEKCDVCVKHKKPTPRPTVGFPLASDHNQTVAVDLHELEPNLWYLHIMDEFSRFSAGCITNTKKSSKFVENFIKHWISIHGAPQRLFSDLGGEFDNEEVRDMAENFNIDVITTPGYSPWSNGLLERHNQTLTEILLKVRHDHQLDWSTALSWALMAKNSLQNVHGYSLYQLVFGRNPNFPSVLTDQPPALEGTTLSEHVRKHINALHASKEAFVKAECSDRIRRALRKQIHSSPREFASGDKIYYKRPDNKKWRGPGTVIGQDGPVVFVRHGGTLVRVHKCRLQNAPLLESSTDHLKDSLTVPERKEDDENQLKKDQPVELDDSETELSSNNDEKENDGINSQIEIQDNTHRRDPIMQHNITVKPGSRISYTDQNSNDKIQAEVLSRAGKVSGCKRNWYNIKVTNPSQMEGGEISVDLSQLTDLEIAEPKDMNIGENVLLTNEVDFNQAKSMELDSWKQNTVYTEVEDVGQKCVSTRWVCSLKSTPDGIIPKARLVARGFEEFTPNIQKDSPTCAHESLRLIIAITAQRQWELHAMDIKTAFLQGQNMDREVYVKPPKEANTNGVWLLNKCVYGLCDASLYWYKKVKSVMLEHGGSVSKVDPTVFYWCDDSNSLVGIFASHVDDFIWSGEAQFECVVNKIRTAFKVGREESKAFKYCGIELTSINGDIYLDQDKYTENMTPINIDSIRAQEKKFFINRKGEACT